ncbi:hypothetical protein HZH68_015691 [Vespula germanica]|uniref:Uncharacterized protein n=1 Tax=Vespula germanica TaxID=30212 RepID=A0A834J5A4_VESGE|nr:hypothetical protein HZH68_015691 [Vespula germanica]
MRLDSVAVTALVLCKERKEGKKEQEKGRDATIGTAARVKEEKKRNCATWLRQNGIRLVDKSDKRPWRALTGGPLLYAI